MSLKDPDPIVHLAIIESERETGEIHLEVPINFDRNIVHYEGKNKRTACR
jgi:hypothetical protein